MLERLALRIPGFWPAGSRERTVQAVCCTPDARFLPVTYPILNSPEVHTANLQITYGCPAFCAFCLEGYDRKPYRELLVPEIFATARRLKQAQGVEELNLYSFNFNTHQDILEMLLELHKLFDRVSLKSQRLDILQHTPHLLEAEVAADKRTFTLGIEGISQRLRAWLHKSLAAEEIVALLERIAALKVRRLKLFYILTGHETDADIAEFRRFVKWLKETIRFHNRWLRVVFSFGLLVRQPRTPLQHDRLFLDEAHWRPIVGQVKSACETNGFEFRLAFDWRDYCVTQVLALGGYWLVEPVVALAQEGHFFDTSLPEGYWDELRGWMEREGHWNQAFLGEKGLGYPFPLEFVASNVSPEFLYQQYQEAESGVDRGYCLGDFEQPGQCLGCGACLDREQRQAITHHHIHQPEPRRYMKELRAVMARKRRLEPAYFVVRVAPLLAGVAPECLNAFVFREIVQRVPELTEDLLAVRESLFTHRDNVRRFPLWSGETVFALKAWDVAELETRFFPKNRVSGSEIIQILRPAENFTPGVYTRLHLELFLPDDLFPQPRAHLEQYLRGAYLRYSLRREGQRYRFDLPRNSLKKKILFDGFFEVGEDGFHASLDVGPKFDPRAFLATFGPRDLIHRARVETSGIEWVRA